ncbi:ADP-ribosylglycohydrolase family protein [Rheinheimera sp. UJ51]|nr:ADP-ribosylglycohydrolase family protein [Rheinheimera sp. UJ51]
MDKAQLRAKTKASMFSAAIGDAFGSPYEFKTVSPTHNCVLPIIDSPFCTEHRNFTDDTQLLIFSAEGLADYATQNQTSPIKSDVLIEAVSHAFQRWLFTQDMSSICQDPIRLNGGLLEYPFVYQTRSPGATCIDALKDMQRLSQPACNFSAGAGALLRLIPHAAFCLNTLSDDDYLTVFKLGSEIAGITHGHGHALVSAGIFNLLMFLLFKGLDLDSSLKVSLHFLLTNKNIHNLYIDKAHITDVTILLLNVVALAKSNTPTNDAIAAIGEGWVSPQALGLAIYANLKAKTGHEMLRLSAWHNGDSDTVCALAGGIYGAIHGTAHELMPYIENISGKPELNKIINHLVPKFIQ